MKIIWTFPKIILTFFVGATTSLGLNIEDQLSCINATLSDIILECVVLQSDGSVQRNNVSLGSSFQSMCNFDISRETRIIVHGWNFNISSFFYTETPVHYAMLNYNVIVVNWAKLSRTFYPVTVQFCLLKVAQKVINFIQFVKDNFELSMSSVTLVGHSLGAHTVGIVGRSLLNTTYEIDKIIGLDPAGPLFGYITEYINNILKQNISIPRLSKVDAKYVTCWHTNSLLFGSNWLPNCDSDIFFGLGTFQLQCIGSSEIFCSHAAAYRYLTYSLINPTCYKGYPKFTLPNNRSKIYVGEPIDHMLSIYGTYDVWTSLREPYCN